MQAATVLYAIYAAGLVAAAWVFLLLRYWRARRKRRLMEREANRYY